MILSRHTFKMRKSVPVRLFPCTCDICSDSQWSDPQFWVPGNLGHQFFCILPYQVLFGGILVSILSQTDGCLWKVQICTFSSSLSFMNVCTFLIVWQVGCCKQPIFYAYTKCSHEFYDGDWWPWKVEQGGLGDLWLGKNGWLLCDTWYLCSMLYISKVFCESQVCGCSSTTPKLLVNTAAASAFKGGPSKCGVKQHRF